jgi:hypothetical protein
LMMMVQISGEGPIPLAVTESGIFLSMCGGESSLTTLSIATLGSHATPRSATAAASHTESPSVAAATTKSSSGMPVPSPLKTASNDGASSHGAGNDTSRSVMSSSIGVGGGVVFETGWQTKACIFTGNELNKQVCIAEATKALFACEQIGMRNNYHFITLHAGVYMELLGIDSKRGKQIQASSLDQMQELVGAREFAASFDSVILAFPMLERFKIKYTQAAATKQ